MPESPPETPDEVDAEAAAQEPSAVTVPPEDQIPVQAEVPAPEPVVPTLTVSPPHSSFSYGGVTVYSFPTAVHPSLIPAIMQSASEAGVILTQEG